MHRLCPMMIAALIVGAVVSNALAQPAPTGIVSSPCPPPDPAAEARLKPIDDLIMTPAASPEAFWAAFTKLQATVLAGDAERNRAQQAADWPNLCRYKAANATLARGPRPRAVFMGDSITDNWVRGDRRCSLTASSVVASAASIAANAGAVPAGRRRAATARRAHHGWHERHCRHPVRRRSRTTSTTSAAMIDLARVNDIAVVLAATAVTEAVLA